MMRRTTHLLLVIMTMSLAIRTLSSTSPENRTVVPAAGVQVSGPEISEPNAHTNDTGNGTLPSGDSAEPMEPAFSFSFSMSFSYSLTDPAGYLPWQGGDYSSETYWFISLNGSYGVALTVSAVNLDPKRGEILNVYRGPSVDDSMLVQSLTGNFETIQVPVFSDGIRGDAYDSHSFSLYQYDIPVAVIFIPSNEVTVEVISKERESTESVRPSLRFFYKAVPMEDIPPILENGRFNCSPPHVIPVAFQCDLIRHCNEGEDESAFSCAYNGDCLKGEMGYKPHCFSFHFPSEPVSPVEGGQLCKDEGYKLLAPQDPELMVIASRLAFLHDFSELLVDVSRVQVTIAGLEHLYRFLWEWGFYVGYANPQVIYGQPVPRLNDPRYGCGVLHYDSVPYLRPVSCSQEGPYALACASRYTGSVAGSSMNLPRAYRVPNKFLTKRCSDDSFTHPFHPCPRHVAVSESASESGNRRSSVSPSEPGIPDPVTEFPETVQTDSGILRNPAALPKLECERGGQVDYTLACDAHEDCVDGSDEERCDSVSMLTTLYYQCTRKPEIISSWLKCNGVSDCLDGSDEEGCIGCRGFTSLCEGVGCLPDKYISMGLCSSQESAEMEETVSAEHDDIDENDFTQTTILESSFYHPERLHIDLDGTGLAELRVRDINQSCPESHYQCNAGTCIPVYLVNNGQVDCPLDDYDHDSDLFATLYCPGYYRCYGYEICLHNDHLCDGIYQCPLKDDERYCDLDCPAGCVCQGLAVTCQEEPWPPQWARYLDVSGVQLSGQWFAGVQYVWYLLFLNISSCGLRELTGVNYLSQLRVLDLSFNQLTDLKSIELKLMPMLTHLNLSNNPLLPVLDSGFGYFLTERRIENLRSLVISSTGMTAIVPEAFRFISTLEVLNIQGNPIEGLEKDMFLGLTSLRHLHTDDQSLCCAFFYQYPGSETVCHAPVDELSSCEDLLRSDAFRGSLWTLAALAVTGNIGVLVYRLFLEKGAALSGFRLLVSSLCVSDFLMGLYLIFIGAADLAYRGDYLWKRQDWTQSAPCTVAGFLALASSEVSAFIMCIITLDRLLKLQFPLKPYLQLSLRGTALACVAAWIVGIILAAIPLLPDPAHWQFYSQTGICLPLPITQHNFPGQKYAFGVFIVLNFVLFTLVGSGQLLIYRAVSSSRIADSTRRRQEDMAIARRLFLIVFSDFCCWFPIGLMGILAARGTHIPGIVNVVAAIFVLPLNSALNPFLYTLNSVRERRRKAREAQRLEAMMRRMHTELGAWPRDSLVELLKHVQRALKSLGVNDISEVIGQNVNGSGVTYVTDIIRQKASATESVSEEVTEMVSLP